MSRTSLLASAFADFPEIIAGKSLRPPTAGTIMLLMRAGNLLFTEEQDADHSEADIMQAMFEFLWVHSEDKTTVVRTCRNPDDMREAAALLGMDLSFEDLAELVRRFDDLRRGMDASLVDVVQEPGEKKPLGETRIPTGSPPSSTPLAAPEIPSASATSSGISPSPAPSNTSTPPTCTTEPAHAGRSPIWEGPPSITQDEENVIPIG